MHIQVSEDFSVPTVCLWLYRTLPDVISTPDLLGPLLDHGDSFVLIQNGVGIEKELRHKLPTATIISGCSWADATIVEKGRSLTHRGRVSHLPRRTGIA
jgi:ketopantoate reductase